MRETSLSLWFETKTDERIEDSQCQAISEQIEFTQNITEPTDLAGTVSSFGSLCFGKGDQLRLENSLQPLLSLAERRTSRHVGKLHRVMIVE